MTTSAQDLENWISIPTVFFSFLSIISCLLVILVSIKKGYIFGNNKTDIHNKKDNKISHEIICIICVCDGLWSIELFLNWLRQITFLDMGYWTQFQCAILGIYSQFLGCLSPLFHMLLAYHLCFLLFGGSLNTLKKQKYIHYFIILLFGILATIFPLFSSTKNEYGIYENPNLYINNQLINDKECWLKDEIWQMIWITFSFFSLFFHYLTLIIAFIKWRQTSFFILSPIYYNICKKILRFVIVYSSLRLPAAVLRLIEISNNNTKLSLLIINHYCQALLGVANFVVFVYNNNGSNGKLIGFNHHTNDQKNLIDNNEFDSSIQTSQNYNNINIIKS